MEVSTEVTDALTRVVEGLPGGGEKRVGQLEMATAISDSFKNRKNFAVQAGTGTGKSLAYLIPAILSNERVIIATATKALQDQLANKDLPLLAQYLDEPVVYTVIKGRNNYLCKQRLAEMEVTGSQLELEDSTQVGRLGKQVTEIISWSQETISGDRSELAFEPDSRVWSSVSVTSDECPGATKCPSGPVCFAESARAAAEASTIVVVNTHLYAIDLISDAEILPEHDFVVIDEAHQLEEIISSVAGIDLAPGRFGNIARNARKILATDVESTAVADVGNKIANALEPLRGQRLLKIDGELGSALALARTRVETLSSALRKKNSEDQDGQESLRILGAAGNLLSDIDLVSAQLSTHVTWVEGNDRALVLRTAPIDVGQFLEEKLWSKRTAVLTSATLPPDLPERLGLPTDSYSYKDVGSPFNFADQALLYCALHMPDPRSDTYREAVVEELTHLITAAEGRTLCLFTSWKALNETATLLADRIDFPLLSQKDFPKPKLIEKFTSEPETVLLATMGFWQGIDVPGDTLSLVTIDKIPFPRPDDPLLQARRDLAGSAAFRQVDLPRAATLLAQGTGRLIRTIHDRGVVAVLDPRLGKANYRWYLVQNLPPMTRTKNREEATDFLSSISRAR
jgi:ATP-dependent DNA helicase DinG